MIDSSSKRKRICIVTAGHLATCPRMLKAADALHEAGYGVRMVSANYIAWAREADHQIRRTRAWSWDVVDYERARSRFLHAKTGVRFRSSRIALERLSVKRIPVSLVARAASRAYPELLSKALGESADLFYGGTSAAIPVVTSAAKRVGVPYGLDIEDLHTGEQEQTPEGRFSEALMDFIQSYALPQASFVTVASSGIGRRIHQRYGGPLPEVILNVFPLNSRPASFSVASTTHRLKVYWFSQTIGPDRGLQEAVEAIALLPHDSVELHLQGMWRPGFEEALRRQWTAAGLDNRYLVAHSPEAPDQLVRSAAQYDVGLALETPISDNRVICMTDLSTNKVFTYLLAGLAIAASSPDRGAEIFEGAGYSYQTGDARGLASVLKRWQTSAALQQARRNAWRLGQSRYNWDAEKGNLVALVREALARFPMRH